MTQVVNPNPVSPWLRTMRVTLGPEGSSSNLVITSGGDSNLRNDMRIACSIGKSQMQLYQQSTVELYNLSRDTRAAIQKAPTSIVVEAGWENTTLTTLYKGNVTSFSSARSGPDIVTRLNFMSGAGSLAKTTVSKTWAAGTSVVTVLKDLAAKLSDIQVDESKLKDIKGTIGVKGWSYAGVVQTGITKLAQEYGFSWNIDDGFVKAVSDLSAFGKVVVLNGKDGGLISITPLYKTLLQIPYGIHISAVFIPGVEVQGYIKIQSSIDDRWNNQEFKVTTIHYNLDTHSDNWNMDIEAIKLAQ